MSIFVLSVPLPHFPAAVVGIFLLKCTHIQHSIVVATSKRKFVTTVSCKHWSQLSGQAKYALFPVSFHYHTFEFVYSAFVVCIQPAPQDTSADILLSLKQKVRQVQHITYFLICEEQPFIINKQSDKATQWEDNSEIAVH